MNGNTLPGTPNLTADQTFHCLNCRKWKTWQNNWVIGDTLPGFHWELATKTTLVTLIKMMTLVMKQDATACLHPCDVLTKPKADGRDQSEMWFAFDIDLARRKPHFRCQYSASKIINISLDSRNSISTVKHSFSLHCTASEGSFVYCTDQHTAYNPQAKFKQSQSQLCVATEDLHLP